MCVTRMIKHRTLPCCWPALHHSGECRSCARTHNYSPGTFAIMFRPKTKKSARFWTVLKCRELAITLRVVCAALPHPILSDFALRIHERNIEFILIKLCRDSWWLVHFQLCFCFWFGTESYISLRRSATAVESQPYVSETLRGQKETHCKKSISTATSEGKRQFWKRIHYADYKVRCCRRRCSR